MRRIEPGLSERPLLASHCPVDGYANAYLTGLACLAIPALRGSRLVRTWKGLVAETRDALPAVGSLPGHPNAFVCGSVHSGFTSGPWIAKLLAYRNFEREPAMPLFPPDRLIENHGEADRT